MPNRGKELGRFVLTSNSGHPVPYGRRIVAVVLADQAGALHPQLRSA
jgi:hypothetical protein